MSTSKSGRFCNAAHAERAKSGQLAGAGNAIAATLKPINTMAQPPIAITPFTGD